MAAARGVRGSDPQSDAGRRLQAKRHVIGGHLNHAPKIVEKQDVVRR
jgi:hypothetical protein